MPNKPSYEDLELQIRNLNQTVKDLKKSEDRLKLAFTIAGEVLWEIDPRTGKANFCDKWFTMLGYSPGELPASYETWVQLTHPKDRYVVDDAVKRCIGNKKEFFSIEFRMRTKKGCWRWIRSKGKACETDRNGCTAQILGTQSDITEQKKIFSRFRFSQYAFDKASVGIFIIDNEGLILDVNKCACETLGYSQRELCTLKIFDIDPSISIDQLQMYRQGKSKTYKTHHETLHRRKDGTNVSVEITLNFCEFDGKVFSIVFQTDITEKKAAEEEKNNLEKMAFQSQKLEALGLLAGGVAHDLNNMLVPIFGYSEILLSDMQISDSQKRQLEQILKAGHGARDLVHQLLAFGRKQVMEYKQMNLNPVIENLQELLRRTIREDIEIKIKLSPNPLQIGADIGQIEQVLINLVVNASDAMPNGGILTIETTSVELDKAYARTHPGVTPGAYTMLSISDTGTGMDEETLMQVFQPFFSTKGEFGTGLGLSTVYGIIQQHKGYIRVDSEPDRGTTFRVYLPLSENARAKSKNTPNKRTVDLRGSETILLVEDDENVRGIAHEILIRQGYYVLTAKDGKEALQKMASSNKKVDLLLTDIIMPGMNGIELYNEISNRYGILNVLYMSGYTDNVIASHGVLDEGVQFIQKPFTYLSLVSKVRDVLDNRFK